MNIDIIKQVAALKSKSIDELRTLYVTLFSDEPHYRANKQQLIPKIAYRLQELDSGGLSDDARQRLSKIARGASVTSIRRHTHLSPGTKLCREWRGVVHEVEVTKTNFEYQGQPFKSLSAVARKITGTRWNGHRFFGLRNNHAKP